MTKKIFLIIIVVAFSFNCGKKGPLKLEPELIPKEVENLEISQLGSNIKLRWDFPKTLPGKKKTELEPEMIGKIFVYYSPKEILGGKFKKKSTLLRKLELKDLTVDETSDSFKKQQNQKNKSSDKKPNLSYFYLVPLELEKLENTGHFFGIMYTYGKKKSPMSTIVHISTVIPVKAVTGLKVTRENKLLRLQWTRPRLDEKGNPVSAISGYNVFKKIQPGEESQPGQPAEDAPKEKIEAAGPPVFKKINKETVLNEYFEDLDTGENGTYIYYVSTIMSPLVESAPSAEISIAITDIYPPDIPANLVSFRASDHMFLTWKDVNDEDLSHYRLYRRSEQQDEFTLAADNITTNHYKDKNIEPGNTYFYVVTALDKKGNESRYSNEVSERF
jgi:hypothetical protein